MKSVKQLFAALGVFLAQFFFFFFLSINLIRPDFLVIYVFYISLVYGKTTGIIIAFTIGLFSDLAGVGSYFGLAPLTLSITAYLTGFLNGKYERFLPYVFHLCWLAIIGFHFFVISYVRFQTLFVTDIFDFTIKCLMSFGYTMMFFLITQYFFPVREASRA